MTPCLRCARCHPLSCCAAGAGHAGHHHCQPGPHRRRLLYRTAGRPLARFCRCTGPPCRRNRPAHACPLRALQQFACCCRHEHLLASRGAVRCLQASKLHCFPRITIKHTSSRIQGQARRSPASPAQPHLLLLGRLLWGRWAVLQARTCMAPASLPLAGFGRAHRLVCTAPCRRVLQCLLHCTPSRKRSFHGHDTCAHPSFTQVYIPEVNFILMVATLAVVLGFQTSAKIGNAYGAVHL